MPKVKVLRSFNKTPQGDLADIGDTIEVDDTRALELTRLGLAEPVSAGDKQTARAAPALANKKVRSRRAART